jgi:hypothetical protein
VRHKTAIAAFRQRLEWVISYPIIALSVLGHGRDDKRSDSALSIGKRANTKEKEEEELSIPP